MWNQSFQPLTLHFRASRVRLSSVSLAQQLAAGSREMMGQEHLLAETLDT